MTCTNPKCERYLPTARQLCWACWLLRRDARLDVRLPQSRSKESRKKKGAV